MDALSNVQKADLVNEFLDFHFSDKVALQDMYYISLSLAANSKARNELWTYIKKHWTRVSEKLSANPVVENLYLKASLSKFASREMENDIAAFFTSKDTRGYDKGLAQVSNTVRANAGYKERDETLVLEWLKAHGYV